MPKPVNVLPIMKRGKRMFRVIIPKSITGGRQRVRFFRTRGEAEKFAAACETTRAQAAHGYEFLNLADRLRVSQCISKVGGIDKLEKAVEGFVSNEPRGMTTVASLISDCLDAKARSGLSGNYIAMIRNTFARFREMFGPRQIHEVTSSEIENWIHSGKWKPETKKGFLKDIRTLYTFARDRGFVRENAAASVPIPKVSRETPGILTPEECALLMTTVSRDFPSYIPFIALTLFGGLRSEEAFRCRWENIKSDVIDLPAGETKNNRRRLIDFAALAVNGHCALKEWLALGGDLPPLWRRHRMSEIHHAVPIAWSRNCLRHTFVSYAVPVHGISQTGLLADHSESILKLHYRALVTRAAADRFWSILPG